MKDVVISIRGIQRSFHPGEEEQGPESVELVTDGRYEYGRDASWFTYQESEITGMEEMTRSGWNVFSSPSPPSGWRTAW